MNTADFVALAPQLVIAGGIVAMLLIVSFWRSSAAAFSMTIAIFLTSLAWLPFSLPALPYHVGELLVVDGFSSLVSGLFVTAALVTAVFARSYLASRHSRQEEFYLLLVLATLGAVTMAVAAHFAALVLGLELLSISLYVLIGYSEEGHPPLEASLKYLILSGVATTTMLFGIALIYNASGVLQMYALSAFIADSALDSSRSLLYLSLGHGLFLSGMAFKLSLVPFHMWTPDVYQGAPSPIAGYLATVAKGAVFAFLLRYTLITGILLNPVLGNVIALFAVLSMIVGNLLALLQHNVKRILAYSSIAHLGYLLIGLVAVTKLEDPLWALEVSSVYLVGYFMMTLAAFGVISVLSTPSELGEAGSIDAYTGLFWRRPVLAVVFTIALLSLTGIPLTMGFIIKFYLVTAGVDGNMWLLLWSLLIGSAIGVYYYLRIIFTMLRNPVERSAADPKVAFDAAVTLCVIGVSLLSFGAYPNPIIESIRHVLRLGGG